MTPVGHILFGATIALAGRSSTASPRATAALVIAAVLCANIPDFPLPRWGHENYRVSHSVVVGAAEILAAAMLYGAMGGLRTWLGG